MKLGFSTLGCPEWDWQDIVSAAADLGYRGVEIRGLQREMYAPSMKIFSMDAAAATMKKLANLGLEIPCLASFAELHNTSNRANAMLEAEHYITLAQRLGVPYVRVLGDRGAAPDAPVDDAIVADSLRKLTPFALARGVTMLVETNGCYASSDRMAALMQQAESPAVAVLWDIHHPYRFFGEQPEETVAKLGQWIRYLHVKDSVMEQGKVRYRMMGAGDVPVAGAVAALRAIGYEGYITLEWVKRWDITLEEANMAFPQFVSYMRNTLKVV